MSLVVDVNKITYLEYSEALDALQVKNDFLESAKGLLKAVVAWDLPVEVGIEGFGTIPFPDAAPVLTEIVKLITEQLELVDLSQYQVNMRGWTYIQFHEFNEAQKAKNFNKVLGMLSSISSRNGQPLNFETLSVADGNAITRVGTDLIGKVFAAKN